MKTFDIRAYLTDKGIPFRTGGKNVTRGWIEMSCPFPFCGDPSMHLGISPSLRFSCWKCGEKGSMYDLVQQLEDFPDKRTMHEIMSPYTTEDEIDIVEEAVTRGVLRLPKEADTNFDQDHYNYLISRGYDPEIIIHKYGLRACHRTGRYRYRLIIPIIMDGEVVSFAGMDYTRLQSPKYKNASNEESTIPVKQCVYNIDSVKDTAVIVEGFTDVWRGGDGFCGTLGIRWTDEQVAVLLWKKPKRAFVMFDGEPEAIEQAKRLAFRLSGAIPTVELVELPDGVDPDSLSDEEMEKFRKEIGL